MAYPSKGSSERKILSDAAMPYDVIVTTKLVCTRAPD
jgi:hypothetical protein